MKRVAYDIAIVGSGAGGGTVAQELSPLCRQGLRIAVLEKGPRLVAVGSIDRREPAVDPGVAAWAFPTICRTGFPIFGAQRAGEGAFATISSITKSTPG